MLALQPVLSTEEQAIEFEKAGRWADAHAFYEQNLQVYPHLSLEWCLSGHALARYSLFLLRSEQKNPTCIKSRLGLLTCLKNLGYLETTLSLVTPSRSGMAGAQQTKSAPLVCVGGGGLDPIADDV